MTQLQPQAPIASGYQAIPVSGSGPGVLVLHAWWGLNDVTRGVCDRLAEAGFVAVAPDLWGGTIATTIEEAESLISNEQRNSEAMLQAATEAFAYLQAHPAVRSTKLGTIGFSMGAAYALALAGSQPELRAVTLFYGSNEVDYNTSQAAFLGHFAENDPYEPDEWISQVEASIREAGRTVQFYHYSGVGHWFFEEDRADAYNPAAAALAWERTVAFLKEQLA